MSNYITYYATDYSQDLHSCEHFLSFYGSNYASAVKAFPRQQQEATTIFYSFLRYADELVDNPDSDFEGRTHLTIDEFVRDWHQVVANGPNNESHPILRTNYWLFIKYSIPFDYSTDFLNVMVQDITKSRYHSYQELVGYMWGSASVVGHMMTFILGYEDAKAFSHAQSLAEAMQLTNFLRDVDDDYRTRQRIYLPQQDMAIFGVTEDMIASQSMTPELTNLVKHYVQRCYELFEKGNKGIHLLKTGRLPVYYASVRYRHYLSILERKNYNIFSTPIQHVWFDKITILITTLITFPFVVLLKNNQ